jgi:hypothetical protein
LDTAIVTWDEVAARGKATFLKVSAAEVAKRLRSLKQALVLIEQI